MHNRHTYCWYFQWYRLCNGLHNHGKSLPIFSSYLSQQCGMTNVGLLTFVKFLHANIVTFTVMVSCTHCIQFYGVSLKLRPLD